MPFSLLQPLREIPVACVDVETTGASADLGDKIIEVGIVRYEGGRAVAEYSQLIDPQRHINGGVIALTGITPAMVAGQPRFCDQLPRMLELMKGAVVLGHNVRFDLSFLSRECRRSGTDFCQALENAHVFDTVRIARRRFGRGGNGLQRLAPRLGVVPTVAHRALPDAVTTAQVFEKLLEPVGGWGLSLCDAIREQGGPMPLAAASPRESLLPLELEEALEQKSAVMMEYLDANEQKTSRVIEPLHIQRRSGELVLIAHCQLRNDRRTFKVERIVQLTRMTDAAPPADATAALSAAPAPAPPAEPMLFPIEPAAAE